MADADGAIIVKVNGDASGLETTMKSAVSSAEREAQKGMAEITETQKNMLQYLTDAYNKAQGEVARLTAEFDKSAKETGPASEETKRLAQELQKAEKAAATAKGNLDKYTDSVRRMGDASQEVKQTTTDAVNQLASALAAAGVAATIKQITDAINQCVSASVEFESAIAGVYKTVDGTDEQLAAISDGVKEMATQIPATTTEIAHVAETAGQLGIATDDILSFTRTMIDLGESTNLSADEAASALAKFANITGTAAEDYGRLGSVIVGLGNNFATTEADIVAMATRLASAGTLAGLTEPQIMALATAMSSVGIEAEAGGTAMTQTLSAIEKAVTNGGEKLETFAEISGTSATEFANLWKTDAVAALQIFIKGLGELDETGQSSTMILDELGMSGVRQSNMLKSLSLAADTLTGAVDLANAEWESNNALTEEASKRYETTESRMAMAKNAADNLRIAIGDALAPVLADLATIGAGAFGWVETVVKDNPWLVQGITATVTVLGLLTAGLTAYSVIAPIAATATGALAAALHLLPFAGIAVAIAAVGAALNSFVKWLGSVVDGTKELEDATAEVTEATSENEEALAKAKEAETEYEESVRNASAANTENVSTLEKLTKATEELQKTTEGLANSVDTLDGALKEQQESGSLSLDTALKLIDAGYESALVIDAETGAITLNREEYIRLANAKIQSQIASLEAQKASMDASKAAAIEEEALKGAGAAYRDVAKAKVLAAFATDKAALDAQIAALTQAQNALNSYSGTATTAAKRTSSAAKKVKTQAEKDLADFKAISDELKHQRKLDEIDDAEYYKKLTEARDRYLTDPDNISEYRSITEEIYKYDKSLAENQQKLWAEQTDAWADELEARLDDLNQQQSKLKTSLSNYGELYTIEDDNLSLENLQDQIDAINRYGEAIQGLKDRQISQSLLDQVMAMSTDDATKYAEQLLSMTDTQYSDYLALWEEKQQAAARVSTAIYQDQIQALQTEFLDKLPEAAEQLPEELRPIGEDAVQALADGMAEKGAEAVSVASGIADDVAEQLSRIKDLSDQLKAAVEAESANLSARLTVSSNAPAEARAARDRSNAAQTAAAVKGMYAEENGTGDVYLDSEKVGKIMLPAMRKQAKATPEVKDDA